MEEIGVRQLKETLSEALRRVSRGEQIRILNRGRPIADLVPVGKARDHRLRRLVSQGRLTLPTHPRPSASPTPVETEVRASDIVLAEREDER